MQPVDYTTLMASCAELNRDWIPSRIEQVYQRDRFTISLALRTLKAKPWLTICWHPEAARINLGDPPPRLKDTFTFSDQLRHQLKGLALTGIVAIAPWERVIDLQFAQRPGEEPLWHLYVEIMGKYSNVILTDGSQQIVTPAKQISPTQSSVRPIQTGQPYELPPSLIGTTPKLEESFARWQERVSLVPGQLKRQLLQSYRGLSPRVATEIAIAAGLSPQQQTDTLTLEHWQALFHYWQKWLLALEHQQFSPGWLSDGYTVLGWNKVESVESVQTLLNRYYTQSVNRQQFTQLHHQLNQKLINLLKKLNVKANTFRQRLAQSADADSYRQQGNLLMAHLHQIQPGMKSITLNDFETGKPIKIKLNPEKNPAQNAQYLYKQSQKLKRAKDAVVPLLADVDGEIDYLSQVQTALNQLQSENTGSSEDLQALGEIKEELIQQKYIIAERQDERQIDRDSQPYRLTAPSGCEIWIGRNNRQNDILTFRTAVEYDLWFHTQEIPGSHVLLRLDPGAVASEQDLQFTADIAAYYSQARESDQVPVIYTKPKYVYKPKGAKPGMVIYKQETVIWGRPQIAKLHC
ncbi:MAG: fibronectin/fibrinogen-binding protein [Pleurocapsa sp. SU_5_0]|nr:fibronectin/fibrinogen-binding protein [Pleurocapsa sp. SU_5_0]NJR45147.1 fibronectin/fibrinogen-binding protein [Hyellaceae cyanobacterium CSU_1_1]